MKYIGAILLIFLIFAIMVNGTYSREEIIEVSIQLVPTSIAQPDLVESTLVECNGIQSALLSKSDNELQITYDKARVTLEDLNHLLASLGYQLIQIKAAGVRATI
ncbi:hypothetical protein ACFL4K_01910 [Candidatus Neomarinimicrobiota bacterium]